MTVGTVGVLRVLVYSPCAAVAAGIESHLGRRAGDHRTVITHEGTYRDLEDRAGQVRPQVAVLHGLDQPEIARWGRRTGTALVVAAGDDWRGADVMRAVRAGATGLVSIDSDLPAVAPACDNAANRRPYLSPPLLHALLAYLAGRQDAQGPPPMGLTGRESQVLRHLAVGRSPSDISIAMKITNRTVKHHLGNVYRKLGVHSQTEAIVRAYREGLVA